MRIGIDLSPITTRPTGVGRYTAAVLERLLATGEFHFRGLASGTAPIDRRILPRLDRYRRLPLPTRALYRLWSATGRPRVDRLLGGVDLYHATNYFLPPVASARRVVTFYDLSFLRHPEWSSPKIVGPFSRGVKRFAHEADAILTCSEASKADIVSLLGVGPDQVHVAYGAVEDGFAPVAREDAARQLQTRFGIDGPFLLFVGTLEPRKNILGLLTAFAQLEDTLPHRLVLIGGPGWGAESIAAPLQRAVDRGRVTHLGYLPNRQDLPCFYSAADAFLFPSFYEGFGLPVLEALACGCPVVTAKNSSLPEVGGDAALYVDPHDPEDIADAIRRVVSDAALRDRLRAAGPEQAARFSWDAAAARTAALYRSLI